MAVFRESAGDRDRTADDRRRHRELVEDAIKKNLGGIVSEESIIGAAKDKKVKVPIKGIKEYQFIYGRNQKGAAAGTGSEKRGDKLGEDAQKGAAKGSGAGDQPGEDIYETEITIEQLIQYLFDDMELPDMDKRKLSDIDSVEYRLLGYQQKGIPPRLAKKRSVIERIKRKQGSARSNNENNTGQSEGPDDRFPFMEEDLRYRRLRTEIKKNYNAVVICIMDVSGSMSVTKKYLARSFYFLLYQFLRLKYENVQIVFVSHTTTAKEVSEDEFFHKGESGGTNVSSGYEKALEIIEMRFNPADWNIYAFHCSDGDNWEQDNEKAVKLGRELCEVCNMFGYVEIPLDHYYSRTLREIFTSEIKNKNFHIIRIYKIEDVAPGLKSLLDK